MLVDFVADAVNVLITVAAVAAAVLVVAVANIPGTVAGIARRATGSGAPRRGAAVIDPQQVSCQFLQICNSTHSAGHNRQWVFFALSGPRWLQKSIFSNLVLGVVLSSLLDGPQTGPKKNRAFWASNLGRFWNHVGAISDGFCVFFRHLNLRPL